MANTPIHSMTDLWNSGGTTYYAIKMDVTNSASAAGSKLFAMQISSVNIFDIDKTGDVTITSVDAGATVGPTLTLKRFSATPAAADVAGKLAFDGMDSAANVQNYADIYATITDPTSTSEDASLTFRNSVAGAMTTQAVITATGWNSMNIGATTPGTGAFTTLSASGAASFTTIAAAGTSLTGNLAISKATPVIALTSTGTGSDSTITENSTGLTYAADANNEVASSFHIWTVDGTQAAALNTSALTLGTNVALAFSGTGAATTRTNLGLVIGTNVQAWDADLDTWATKTAPSGVVVGTTDSQTLTNKTLTGAILNGTLGATTPSTVAATTLTTSSTIVASGTTTATRFITTGVGSATNPAIAVATAGVLAGLYSSASNTLNFAINTASVGTVTSTGLNAMAIGASTASTGAFTTLNATGGGALTGTWTNLGTVTTIDINGGTIDGTAIGGATPAAGAFTTISATGDISQTKATPTFTQTDTGSGSVNFIQSGATLLFSVDGANAVALSAVQFNVDGAARMSVNATALRMLNGITLRFATYTVATLPAGSTGDTVFATDCRVFNGAGTQEGAGLGTGGLVTYNGAAWKIEGTNVTAVA